MSGFSYISLASKPGDRAFFLAVGESINILGTIIGNIISGPIIDNFGLDVMVYINVGTCILAALIVVVFVKDINKPGAATFKWKDLFRVDQVADVFRTVYKKRSNYSRLVMHMCYLIYASVYALIVGASSLGFLYFVKEVGLSMTQYSILNAVSTFLKSVTCPAVLYAAKRFNFNQLTGSLFSAVALVFSFISLSLGPQIYFILTFAILSSGFLITFAVMRSIQSNIAARHEFGKIFTFDSLIQVSLNTGVTILFNFIYMHSLSFWPQLFAAFLAFICIFTLALIAGLILLLQKVNPQLLV